MPRHYRLNLEQPIYTAPSFPYETAASMENESNYVTYSTVDSPHDFL